MEIDIKKVIEENKENMAKVIEEYAIKQLEESLKCDSHEIIANTIIAFLEKQVKPELKKKLFELKAEIISNIMEYINEMGLMLGKKMLGKAQDNITKEWKFDKIIEALFD